MNGNIQIYILLFTLGLSVLGFLFFVLADLFNLIKNHSQKNILQQSFFGFVTLALFTSLLMRGIALMRFPCSNLYESLLIVALAVAGITAYLLWKYKIGFLAWPSCLLITALLAYALNLPESQREAIPLIPALNSYWRAIHVPALLLSYGFLTVAGITAAFYLFEKFYLSSSNTASQSNSKENKLNFYQELIYNCVALGFPLLTFGIITGALWANHAWGNLWQWDPKENLALATWFIYLAYLHLKVSGKASAATLAWINLVGIIAIYLTYFGINQFDLGGLHTYGKV